MEMPALLEPETVVTDQPWSQPGRLGQTTRWRSANIALNSTSWSPWHPGGVYLKIPDPEVTLHFVYPMSSFSFRSEPTLSHINVFSKEGGEKGRGKRQDAAKHLKNRLKTVFFLNSSCQNFTLYLFFIQTNMHWINYCKAYLFLFSCLLWWKMWTNSTVHVLYCNVCVCLVFVTFLGAWQRDARAEGFVNSPGKWINSGGYDGLFWKRQTLEQVQKDVGPKKLEMGRDRTQERENSFDSSISFSGCKSKYLSSITSNWSLSQIWSKTLQILFRFLLHLDHIMSSRDVDWFVFQTRITHWFLVSVLFSFFLKWGILMSF